MVRFSWSNESKFKASEANCQSDKNCPCCSNIERLFIEQVRIVSSIVSMPFHPSTMSTIGPALGEIRLRGRELVAQLRQRGQTNDFCSTVQKFGSAVEAYCAALGAIDGLGEARNEFPESDLHRAFGLRRALTSMAMYSQGLADEAVALDGEK